MIPSSSNWSLAGYFVGLAIIIISAIRYFIIYPDTSQGIIYIYAGVSIMAFAYLYNENLKLNNTLNGIEEYMADK